MWGRQSATQLARQAGKSSRWVRRQIEYALPTNAPLTPQPTVIVADTTFWGHTVGVCVLRSPSLRRNLWWREVNEETAEVYAEGRRLLEQAGWILTGAVIDGKRGVARAFSGIPVQICHFHQIKMVTRRTTRRPRIPAAQQLLSLTYTLPRTTEMEFLIRLEEWRVRFADVLNEKTPCPCCPPRRWSYTHRKLRAAYRSLHTNLPYLFTHQKYPERHIPNTTNTLDGMFSQLKNRLGVHRGLRTHRRYKLICEILGGQKREKTA